VEKKKKLWNWRHETSLPTGKFRSLFELKQIFVIAGGDNGGWGGGERE
jgi:hypothetical protein